MEPLDARLEDARAWLQKADLDLRRAAAHVLTAQDADLSSDAAFHAQQAAEKSLKAFLAWHDVPFRKTHSLEELGQQCLTLDSSLRQVIDAAVPLTEYAWRFRYPGEIDQPSREEAEAGIAAARQLRAAVLARLPKATRL